MKIPNDPRGFNTPNRETLSNLDVGSLGLAVLTLTRELWVLTDRMHVMEAVLAKHGLDIAEEITQHKPDSVLSERLERDGTALIERILASLSKD